MNVASFAKRLVSEATGTAFLLAAVVGSGVMAERLSGGNTGLALLANAVATGGALVALILTFGPSRPLQSRCHHRRCGDGREALG
jgi:glycerol uptake facilitator-like aquaporin